MYIYTDDDLTKINRDYLGPKGKRVPWVWTYRTYGVVLAVVVGLFALFVFVGVPLNQWTGLAFFFVAFLLSTYVVRRLNGDVGIVAMFQAGWQEVRVPRSPRPNVQEHQIQITVRQFDYDAVPAPRWWEFKARQDARRAQGLVNVPVAPKRSRNSGPGPIQITKSAEAPMTRRASKQRDSARK